MDKTTCSKCHGTMILQQDKALIPWATYDARRDATMENGQLLLAKVYICNKCYHIEFESVPRVI
ncbi:hypothetical protein [Proteiniclasticum sp.]|uniref:hypothetical protein n=1 Tax=Proteiniclasticum sp. TaxID=2053595 RepID=UPI00289BEB2B|nr:hypothetical protein [Proteiniclasticum sp.]